MDVQNSGGGFQGGFSSQNVDISKPTLVHADNKQANQLCSEDLVTQGNMYFRTGYHYCKEAVRDMYCTVQYVDTALNISDAMTKGLGSNKINTFVHSLHGAEPLPDCLLTIAPSK